MIYVICIEDNKLYRLSGDDDSFEIYEELPMYGNINTLIHNPLRMHKEDFLRRVAEAKLAGFNTAFHCHQRAYMNQLKTHESKVHIATTPQGSGKSWLYDKWKKQREMYEKFSSLPIEYKPGP